MLAVKKAGSKETPQPPKPPQNDTFELILIASLLSSTLSLLLELAVLSEDNGFSDLAVMYKLAISTINIYILAMVGSRFACPTASTLRGLREKIDLKSKKDSIPAIGDAIAFEKLIAHFKLKLAQIPINLHGNLAGLASCFVNIFGIDSQDFGEVNSLVLYNMIIACVILIIGFFHESISSSGFSDVELGSVYMNVVSLVINFAAILVEAHERDKAN